MDSGHLMKLVIEEASRLQNSQLTDEFMARPVFKNENKEELVQVIDQLIEDKALDTFIYSEDYAGTNYSISGITVHGKKFYYSL
ncbi:hypothetical protein JCM19047_3945 [Bacillus sp. JCM 19047]|nr:hypothetical protein JCM19047_3945 [Bacillus sp. JCM 19047]